MADLTDKKQVGAPFSNATEKIKVVYDFAKDAGAQGALAILKATENVIIKSFYVKVLTAMTSGGAAVIDVGKTGALESLIKDLAFDTPALGAVVYDGTNQVIPQKLATNEEVIMTIATADLTAGKLEFCFEIEKF